MSCRVCSGQGLPECALCRPFRPESDTLTPERIKELLDEGMELRRAIEKRIAPMKRGPFKPDPRDAALDLAEKALDDAEGGIAHSTTCEAVLHRHVCDCGASLIEEQVTKALAAIRALPGRSK